MNTKFSHNFLQGARYSVKIKVHFFVLVSSYRNEHSLREYKRIELIPLQARQVIRLDNM